MAHTLHDLRLILPAFLASIGFLVLGWTVVAALLRAAAMPKGGRR